MRKLLSEFKNTEKVKIIGMNCGKKFGKRLCDLGLFEGTEITIIKNDDFGPVVVKVLNSKIALGRGETNKIYGEKI